MWFLFSILFHYEFLFTDIIFIIKTYKRVKKMIEGMLEKTEANERN